MTAAAAPSASARTRWTRVLAWVLLVLVLLATLLVLFPWDWLRGPLNRYVSERTGRHFEITRRLDVQLGVRTRVIADGLEFGNPPWAVEPFLVQAERAEVELNLLPLIMRRQVELRWVSLRRPKLGLEMLPDGRRSWSLEKSGDSENTMVIGAMEVDQGSLRFIAPHHGADIRADFVLDAQPTTPEAGLLPLSFRGGGRWRGESFVAEGRTGNVLALRDKLEQPFPVEISATQGRTSVRAAGRVASLSNLEGADITLSLRGRNLSDLDAITGLVLPATPAYSVEGRLRRTAERWQATDLRALVGRTPLSGEISYDTSADVPLLTGALQSRRLDFDDLAPLIGMGPSEPRSRTARQPKAQRPPGAKVLPATAMDVSRLRRMNADVRFNAERVVDARPVPVERLSVHVKLKDGALLLEPLDLGLAGGRLSGAVQINGATREPRFKVDMQAQGLRLERLMPSVELNRASTGLLRGKVNLSGQGASVAQMLGSASGDVALLMGKGSISNLLMEFAGLDGGEIIKFMMGRDQRVQLRCAAMAFNVEQGVMGSRALVLDTADTVVYGHGTINLGSEQLDLLFRPFPKDASILALRSPLKMTGTLGRPEAGVDKAAIAGRAAVAIALGAINPLLGLAATIETGPGEDADCTAVLKQAANPQAGGAQAAPQPKAPAAAGRQPQQRPAPAPRQPARP